MAERLNGFKVAFDTKVGEVKTKIADGAKRAANWIADNKEIVLVVVPATLTGLKIGTKAYRNHREDQILKRRFYDPRRGRYSYARRDLKKRELREIDRRYEDGESYQAILDDLGLLK